MIGRFKTGIVIVYYGNWPGWIDYFLKSCSWNKEISWLIFSDRSPSDELPSNVSFFQYPTDRFTTRVTNETGIAPKLLHPYKLTDFKPAYGVLFRDYLRDYSHWGYSDVDLIYGSINKFIDDGMLDEYDIISPSPDFYPGHFMLFKNTNATINLFKAASNWQKIFSSDKYYCFDENLLSRGIKPENDKILTQIRNKTRYHLLEYKMLRNPVSSRIRKAIPYKFRKSIKKNPEDFNSIIRHKTGSGELKAYRKLLFRDDIINLLEEKRKIRVKWKNGELFDDDKEIMYYHFQLAKYEDSFKLSADTEGSFTLSAQLKT